MSTLTADLHRVRYGEETIVPSCAFAVDGPGLMLVHGVNGAGKSTVIRAMAGLCRADGVLELDGRQLIGLRADERVAAGLVMLPQQHALFLGMTVREHFRLAPDVDAMRESFEAIAHESLQEDRPVALLSGGQRRAVAIAFAMSFHPRVLMLDEPAAGLDDRARDEMREAIFELQRRVRVLLVEHDDHWFDEVADAELTVSREGCSFQAREPVT